MVDEYPRADVEDYRQAIESAQRKPATVVTATFELVAPEVEAIEKEFGKGVVADKKLTVSKKYDNTLTIGLTADEKIAGAAVLNLAGMEGELKSLNWKTLKELETAWQSVATQKAQAFSDANAKLPAITEPDEKKQVQGTTPRGSTPETYPVLHRGAYNAARALSRTNYNRLRLKVLGDWNEFTLVL